MTTSAAQHEAERMLALARYDILDTGPEETFDRITRLTRRFFHVPISTVTLLDGHRQWFKSREGLAALETPRGVAMCNVAIAETAPLIVPDTLLDPRFRDNPYVAGPPHIRFYAGAQLRTPSGYNVGTLCAVDTKPRDVSPEEVETLSDLARIVVDALELRILATTDALTGALSRRGLQEEGERALALAIRHRHDLSCLMLDLDRFKQVNDTHGHLVGDLALAHVSSICQETLRKSDLFGRMGGEEFAILLPHTGAASAAKVAEKLRSRIAKRHPPAPALSAIPLTVSIGIATLDRTAQELDTLLKRADEALYEAKADGRNRCAAWKPPAAETPPAMRRRVFKAGRVAFNGGHSVIDCTVRTLSETGASFDVVSTAGLPDEFKLNIESDQLSRLVRVVSKRDRHVEVAFV